MGNNKNDELVGGDVAPAVLRLSSLGTPAVITGLEGKKVIRVILPSDYPVDPALEGWVADVAGVRGRLVNQFGPNEKGSIVFFTWSAVVGLIEAVPDEFGEEKPARRPNTAYRSSLQARSPARQHVASLVPCTCFSKARALGMRSPALAVFRGPSKTVNAMQEAPPVYWAKLEDSGPAEGAAVESTSSTRLFTASAVLAEEAYLALCQDVQKKTLEESRKASETAMRLRDAAMCT